MGKEKKKAVKTAKPTNLKITRNGNNYTFSWSKPTNYKDGQYFRYRVNGGKWLYYGTKASINVNATSITRTITNTSIRTLEFQVMGDRDEKKDKYKDSDWAVKKQTFAAPQMTTPSLSISGDDVNYVSTFSWPAHPNPSSGFNPFLRYEVRTALTSSAVTDVKKVTGWGGWSRKSAAASSMAVTEAIGIERMGKKRWFQIRAVGHGGTTAAVTRSHVYGVPLPVTAVKTEGKETATNKTEVVCSWVNSSDGGKKPYTDTTLQYKIVTPAPLVTFPPSEEGNFENYRTYKGANTYTDAAIKNQTYDQAKSEVTMVLDSIIPPDRALFIRYETKWDNEVTHSTPVLVRDENGRVIGRLSNPDQFTATPDMTQHVVTIGDIGNNSEIDDSFLVVTYYPETGDPIDIGVIPHSVTSDQTFTVPADMSARYSFGLRAVVGTYDYTVIDGVKHYTVNEMMTSGIVTVDGEDMPIAPADTSVVATIHNRNTGTVKLAWEWTWPEATGAELSWSDNPDSWESTDEPSTYSVGRVKSPYWYISELEKGKTWYFRVRLFAGDGDDAKYSEWSVRREVDLTTAPTTPQLMASTEYITEDGEVTFYWAYASADGTAQGTAEIREFVNGEPSDNNVIVQGAQSVSISASDMGWTAGTSHQMRLALASESGKPADDWSNAVTITVAEKISIAVQTSLKDVDGAKVLDELPLTVSTTGAGNDGRVSVAIERRYAQYLSKPNAIDGIGNAGETIALKGRLGDDQVSIAYEDLRGGLDETADYNLIVSVKDGMGQSDEVTIPFTVEWAHQAVKPEAVVEMVDGMARITPQDVTGLLDTDVFDIYRMTAERHMLIYSGAKVGDTIVDPYPTIGSEGGYIIVTRTRDGDTTTKATEDEGSQLAWEFYEGWLDTDKTLIDFGENRVELQYNVDVSHGWEKDFVKTKYLGGHITGDYNVGVDRNGSVNFVGVPLMETDIVKKMRSLAEWTEPCLVRMPDGTSIVADVQVTEDRDHDRRGMVIPFSMKIEVIDPAEYYRAITLSEWEAEA